MIMACRTPIAVLAIRQRVVPEVQSSIVAYNEAY